MPPKVKSKKEQLEEQELNKLMRILEQRGISVRREKLSRGHSYRVKSGDCVFSGENLVFVDKRLPIEQQQSVIVDYMIERRISPDSEELQDLSTKTRSLLIG